MESTTDKATMVTETKQCLICGNDLPLEAFGYKKVDGKVIWRSTICRKCQRAREEKRAEERRKNAPTHKVCKDCGQRLPIHCFNKNPHCSDGYENRCTMCKSVAERKYRLRRQGLTEQFVCEICGKQKDRIDKVKNVPCVRKVVEGKEVCRDCYAKEKDRMIEKLRANPPKEKICSKCKETKPISEFYKDFPTPDGMSYLCKNCAREARRAYYNSRKRNR